MTYEKALEGWARTRWVYIPRSATDFRLHELTEDALSDSTHEYYVDFIADGYGLSTPSISMPVNTLMREIVNTALGVIE